MKSCFAVSSPLGRLVLVEEDGALTNLCFDSYAGQASVQETPLLHQAAQELEEYFCGKRKAFTVPLRPAGTPFQQRCWEALCRIPYGQTRSYAQQAADAGHPSAFRAVGMANHRNPIPILIPCHRVIGKNGAPVGYAGGLDKKQTLLAIERMNQP